MKPRTPSRTSVVNDPTDVTKITQGNVGDPVTATDSNTIDLLTYTLSGPDMALFKITSDDGTDDTCEVARSR